MADKLPCVPLLPSDMQDEFVEQFTGANQGDKEPLAWIDAQKADIEYYLFKRDLHIMANARIHAGILRHTEGPNWGARAVLVQDRLEGGIGFPDVESRAKSIKGKVTSILSDLMDNYRPRAFGFHRNADSIPDLVREIKGEKTGNQQAEAYASAWKQAAEYVRKRLNRSGARIAKLDDWGMPQYNDPARISEVTSQEWLTFLEDKLDWERMVDDTGLDGAALRQYILDEVYPSIVTQGATKIDITRPTGKPTGTGLLTALRQHRFLHFKDADGWMAYQQRFGSDDFVSTLNEWLERMSHDIAAMEVLGPEPQVGLQHMKTILRQMGETKDLNWIDKLYDNVMGNVGVSNVKAASIMSGIRQGNVVMHLGGAPLSMITDPVFTAMTAMYNDIPVFKTLMRSISMAAKYFTAQQDDFKFLSQLGFVSDYATDRLLAAARYTDIMPHKIASRISEASVRFSMMHGLTVAGRAAFALEFAAAIARDVGKEFGELSARRQAQFTRVGIDARMWDNIRKRGTIKYKGVEYIDINTIGANTGKEQATRIGALINQETAYAVPTPGAEVRAWQNQGQARGTIVGEASRTAMEFKSFPITFFITHLRRMTHGKAMDRRMYGLLLAAGLFGMGHISTQIKDINKGRDPMSLQDDDGSPNWEAISRAAMQGGALGVYGDLVFQDQTRFGFGIGSTVLGPTGGLAEDTIKLMQQAAFAIADDVGGDERKKLRMEALRIGKEYMPMPWQTRGLQDRAMNKVSDALTDGEWSRKMRRQERTRRKKGQTQFWAEDDWLPSRLPEVQEGRAD